MSARVAGIVRLQSARAPRVDLHVRFTHAVLLVFLLSQLFAGVLRWGLGMFGLQALIYVPTLLMVLEIGWSMLDSLRTDTLSRATLCLLCALVIGALVGLCSLPVPQVAFGGWVLAPLVFGYAANRHLDLDADVIRRAALALLLLACAGVIINAWVSYPWIGANFELGGKEISGARDWSIGERQRLAGFSRSSFDAAGQIAMLVVACVVGETRRWRRAALWLLATTAVMLTTARGILLAMAIAAIAIEGGFLGRRIVARALLMLGGLWMILPPLLAWTVDFSQTARLQLHSSHGSYLDRLANMWPQALQLWQDAPLPWLGRGLGGIGAAQTLFEPSRFNAADNLFVYHCVALGMLALPILAATASGIGRIGASTRADAPMLRAFALLVVWYGAVSNIVEHPVLAAGYGLLLHRGLSLLRSCPSA